MVSGDGEKDFDNFIGIASIMAFLFILFMVCLGGAGSILSAYGWNIWSAIPILFLSGLAILSLVLITVIGLTDFAN